MHVILCDRNAHFSRTKQPDIGITLLMIHFQQVRIEIPQDGYSVAHQGLTSKHVDRLSISTLYKAQNE
jgi:hypothetical protein